MTEYEMSFIGQDFIVSLPAWPQLTAGRFFAKHCMDKCFSISTGDGLC